MRTAVPRHVLQKDCHGTKIGEASKHQAESDEGSEEHPHESYGSREKNAGDDKKSRSEPDLALE